MSTGVARDSSRRHCPRVRGGGGCIGHMGASGWCCSIGSGFCSVLLFSCVFFELAVEGHSYMSLATVQAFNECRVTGSVGVSCGSALGAVLCGVCACVCGVCVFVALKALCDVCVSFFF